MNPVVAQFDAFSSKADTPLLLSQELAETLREADHVEIAMPGFFLEHPMNGENQREYLEALCNTIQESGKHLTKLKNITPEQFQIFAEINEGVDLLHNLDVLSIIGHNDIGHPNHRPVAGIPSYANHSQPADERFATTISENCKQLKKLKLTGIYFSPTDTTVEALQPILGQLEKFTIARNRLTERSYAILSNPEFKPEEVKFTTALIREDVLAMMRAQINRQPINN